MGDAETGGFFDNPKNIYIVAGAAGGAVVIIIIIIIIVCTVGRRKKQEEEDTEEKENHSTEDLRNTESDHNVEFKVNNVYNETDGNYSTIIEQNGNATKSLYDDDKDNETVMVDNTLYAGYRDIEHPRVQQVEDSAARKPRVVTDVYTEVQKVKKNNIKSEFQINEDGGVGKKSRNKTKDVYAQVMKVKQVDTTTT